MPRPGPYRRLKKSVALLTVGVLGTLFVALNPLSSVLARENGESNLFDELKVFTDVLSIVRRDYVREVDGKKLIEGAIRGMLAALDPHSGYLDPDFFQDLQAQTKGEFGGLGIEITVKDGLLIVVAPMEGSPAQIAGVRAGDAIIKIEGDFTKDFTLVDAVKRLRGPKGTPVKVSVLRKGVPDLIDITIVRDNIVVKSVKSRFLSDGIGYARISQFVEKTGDDLRAALKKLHRESEGGQLKGLVLDLRNNPGGLLTQAVQVGDLFLSEGVIVYTDGRIEGQKQKFFAQQRGTELNYPIVVIVNSGSASASEIIAGALKDHGRALILGTQTFGKGSVQTITPLANGGALSLTTALYYTKSGNSIQSLGVKPDIELESLPIEGSAEESKGKGLLLREKDLPGAIKNPDLSSVTDTKQGEGDESSPSAGMASDVMSINPEKENISDWLSKDNQLRRAVDLLRGFGIFKAEKLS